MAIESYTKSHRTLIVTADVSSMYGFTGKPYFLVCLENRKNSEQMGPVEVIEDRCVVLKFHFPSSFNRRLHTSFKQMKVIRATVEWYHYFYLFFQFKEKAIKIH